MMRSPQASTHHGECHQTRMRTTPSLMTKEERDAQLLRGDGFYEI